MFGNNTGGNPMFPILLPDNQFQYDFNASTQLQLFGQFPAGCSVDPVSYLGNEQVSALNRPVKRCKEAEDASRQQRHQISLNKNFNQEESVHSTSFLKPNPVSTGLKLSYDDEEPKSSVTSASGSIVAALPVISSLGDNLRTELDRQKEEFDHYIRVQEEQIAKGVREMKQRHMASFLCTIEKGVSKKLMEKEIEIDNMNRKNRELVERIKQVATEVQSWHYRAKYNESVVNVLKGDLNKAIAQAAEQGKEGFGDSEVDCASSSYIDNNHAILGGHMKPFSGSKGLKERLTCRACMSKDVSILLLPCRHLCLCKTCDASISVSVCPVCQSTKTTSVEVYMS